MEERRTDPRLLNLILAAMGFVNAQASPKNPFVRGLGQDQNDQQSYQYLIDALNDCEEYYPEVQEFLDTIILSESE